VTQVLEIQGLGPAIEEVLPRLAAGDVLVVFTGDSGAPALAEQVRNRVGRGRGATGDLCPCE
jgi:predicted amidohydrolase